MSVGHLHFSFWKHPFRSSAHVLIRLLVWVFFFFFDAGLFEFLVYFGYEPLVGCITLQTSFPIQNAALWFVDSLRLCAKAFQFGVVTWTALLLT